MPVAPGGAGAPPPIAAIGPASPARRIAAIVGATLAIVSVATTIASVASLGRDVDLVAITARAATSSVTSGLLAAAWILVLAPRRRLSPRHVPWLVVAALVGAFAAGYANSSLLAELFVSARARGWHIGLILSVGDMVSLLLRAIAIGATLTFAVRALAARADVDAAAEAVRLDARTLWLGLGLFQGAEFAMNAVFVGRVVRFAPEASLAVSESLRWSWSASLLAVAIGIAIAAVHAARQPPARSRWLLSFFVGLAVSGPAFLAAVRIGGQAMGAAGMPPAALAPAITLVWAVLALLAGAALLGRRRRLAASD